MNFIFSRQKQYFTHSLRSFVNIVLPLENKIHIFAPPCNILCVLNFNHRVCSWYILSFPFKTLQAACVTLDTIVKSTSYTKNLTYVFTVTPRKTPRTFQSRITLQGKLFLKFNFTKNSFFCKICVSRRPINFPSIALLARK